MKKQIIEDMIKYGEKFVRYGFNNANSGNMSARLNLNKMLITKTGTMFDELTKDDFVEVDISGADVNDKLASVEAVVHKEIYKKTEHDVILHVHSPMAIVLSIVSKQNKIIPVNMECKYFFKEIPIIEGESGSVDLGVKLADVFENYKCVIVKEHGIFGVGADVRQVYNTVCMIEQACRIKYFVER